MKLRSLLCGVAVAASALLPCAARADKACAYTIPVQMAVAVESAKAKPGQTFRFRVEAESVSDDGTVIPRGTMGYGIVRSASSAGRHAHDGSLALEPRYLMVRKPNGNVMRVEVAMNPLLPVLWTPNEPLLQKAASHVPLPLPGMAMTAINTLRWGRNITLGPGFTFSVLPVHRLDRGPIC